jgi:tRNA pseudouridine13 synthase
MISDINNLQHNLAYAFEKPNSKAVFKHITDDFIVKEQLPFQPDGTGTHAFLWIEKTSLNTLFVIELLAKFTGLAAKHIGYAGLKDKQAITSQWFSINLEGLSEPNWAGFSHPGVKIKKITYHKKKLKTGSVKANEFTILLRNIEAVNADEIEQRLEKISHYGVPNYFGPQRFGINNQNISKAADWFSGKIKINQRSQKSIILSAARSMLFNQLLSQRITEYGWHQIISGEVMMLNGSHSIFVVSDPAEKEIQSRFDNKDIHPTLSLWGKGELMSKLELLKLENNLFQQFSDWCKSLENKGLKKDRRVMRVIPEKLQYHWINKNQLQLKFSLPKGCYATSILRELVVL